MSAQPIGIDAAMGRIQEIQSLQQQLLDPTVAAPSASASAASGATAGTGMTIGTDTSGLSGTGTDTDFASLLTALVSAGSTSATAGAATASTGDGAVPSAVEAMTEEANSLVGKPYVWGGGHSGWGTQTGYDCSGFVSAVLHAGGYLSAPQDTATLASAAGIESGAGQYVTIYDRTDRGLGQDHVIIDIGGQFYESGGESGAWGGGGGVQKIATPSASYLASFNRILHPAGL